MGTFSYQRSPKPSSWGDQILIGSMAWSRKNGANKSAFKINNANSIFTFWKLYTVKRNDYFNERQYGTSKITKIIALGSHWIPILHSYIFFYVLSRVLYNVTSGSKYLHDTQHLTDIQVLRKPIKCPMKWSRLYMCCVAFLVRVHGRWNRSGFVWVQILVRSEVIQAHCIHWFLI